MTYNLELDQFVFSGLLTLDITYCSLRWNSGGVKGYKSRHEYEELVAQVWRG